MLPVAFHFPSSPARHTDLPKAAKSLKQGDQDANKPVLVTHPKRN